jgi:hypothetical protein
MMHQAKMNSDFVRARTQRSPSSRSLMGSVGIGASSGRTEQIVKILSAMEQENMRSSCAKM